MNEKTTYAEKHLKTMDINRDNVLLIYSSIIHFFFLSVPKHRGLSRVRLHKVLHSIGKADITRASTADFEQGLFKEVLTGPRM